jgi:hypothetical protein
VTPALVTLDASLPDISASAPEETPTQIAARLLKEEDESKGKQKAMWRQWFRMQVGFTVGIVTFFYVAFGLVPGNPLVGLKGYETKVNPDGTVTKKLPDHMTARPGLINLLPHGESNMPDAVRERFLRQQYQEAHHNANQPRLSNRELGLTTDRLGEGTQQGWEASEGARLAMETAKKIIEKENKGIFAAKANTNNAPNVISVGSNAK